MVCFFQIQLTYVFFFKLKKYFLCLVGGLGAAGGRDFDSLSAAFNNSDRDFHRSGSGAGPGSVFSSSLSGGFIKFSIQVTVSFAEAHLSEIGKFYNVLLME